MEQGALLFLLLFLPLVFCPLLFNSYELTKVVFFRFSVELLLGLYWLGILDQFSSFFKNKKKNIISLGVLVYCLWVLMTSLGGEVWSRSLLGNYFRQQGFFTLIHFIFLFLLVVLLQNQIKEKFLARAIISGSFLASLYVLYQSLFFLALGDLNQGVAGSFGNPNFLGGYLVITLPFSVYLARRQKFFFLFLLLQTLGIIFSGSRIAIFLLLALGCFYLFYFLKKRWLALVLIGVLILAVLPFIQEVSPYENREKIWRKGLEAFAQRPITGWGLENFEYAFSSVLIPEKDIGLAEMRVDKAHNEFLEILVASGVMGLGLYLFIIASSLKILWEKIRSSKNQEWWLTVFLSLCLFILRSQVNPLSIPENVLFWLLIGLTAGSMVSKRKIHFKGKKFLSLIVVLSLIFMAVFNFRSLLADYFFKQGIMVEGINKTEASYFFQKAKQTFPWEEVYQIKSEEYNM